MKVSSPGRKLYNNGICSKPNNSLSKTHGNISKLLAAQKVSDMLRHEHRIQHQAQDKYHRFKKSASLPHNYLNQQRLNKITTIYRSLTHNRLRTYSQNRSSRPSSQTPQHKKNPYAAPFLNSTNHNISTINGKNKQKNKLTLFRGTQNQSPSTQEARAMKGKQFVGRLSDILKSSDSLFSTEFEKCCLILRQDRNREGEDVFRGLRLLEECCHRREEIRVEREQKRLQQVEREMGDLMVEAKKKSIRATLDQKNLQTLKSKLKEAELRIQELQKKQKKQAGVNTEPFLLNSTQLYNSNSVHPPKTQGDNQVLAFTLTNTDTLNAGFSQGGCSPASIKLAEAVKRLHQYKQRQSQLLAVLVVLQKEGIDVQRVYSDIVKGRVSASEAESQVIQSAVERAKESQREVYRKCRRIKMDSSMDADASIISSTEGLSFNYLDKSVEEEIFSVRREYRCRQDLGALREQLKLDFQVLYEEVDPYDYEDEEGQVSEDIPTM